MAFMKLLGAVGLGFALAIASGTAQAEEPRAPEPSSGVALLVVGSLAAIGGVADLAATPICYAARIPSSQHPACTATSISVGVALVGAGVPMIAVGAMQRSAWTEWLRGVTVTPTRTGAAVGWGGTF